MDVDLARIAAVKSWSREVDRTIAAAEKGAIDSLVALLGGGPLPTDLATRLVEASALLPLVEEFTTTATGPRLADIVVASPTGRELLAALVDGPVGTELSVVVAKPDAAGPLGAMADSTAEVARSLARHLVESRSVLGEAETILRPPPGRASAKDLLDHGTGQRVADRLGRDNSGLSLLDYLAKRPAVRHLALALVADRGNHQLAVALASCRGSQRLTSLVVAARERGPIAEALVTSRAGRAIAMSLQGTSQDRQLVNDLTSDATGQRLMAALGEDSDGPFSQQPAEQIAVLRLVVTVSLLLILVMDPLSVTALSLIVAGVVATDLGSPAGSDEATVVERETGGTGGDPSTDTDPETSTVDSVTTVDLDGPGGAASTAAAAAVDRDQEPATTASRTPRSVRVTVDRGPGATMTELGTLLHDLDALVAVAAEVAATPAGAGGAAAAVGPAGAVTVTEASYRNPLELVLTTTEGPDSVAHLVALAPLIRFWGLEPTRRHAELRALQGEATKAEVEALDHLLARFELADPERSRAVAAGLVGADSAVVTALDRLTELSVTVTAKPDPDRPEGPAA